MIDAATLNVIGRRFSRILLTHLLLRGCLEALFGVATDIEFVLGMMGYGGSKDLTAFWKITGGDWSSAFPRLSADS